MSVDNQIEIKIGEVLVPVIIHKGKNYYPVSYISSKVLLRNSSIISKDKRDIYEPKIFNIDYGYDTGGIQEVGCIDECVLSEVINGLRIGAMSSEQKKNLNYLREYLKMKKINEGERFVNNFNYSHYNEFIKDSIEEVLNENPKVKWQMCSKCSNYYPLHDNFFNDNLTSSKEKNTICKDCTCSNNRVTLKDNYLNNIYYKFGLSTYKLYKEHATISIYEHYINSNLNHVPKIICNYKDYLIIIKYLIDKGKIYKNNINQTELINKYKLHNIRNILPMGDLYSELFGEDYYLYPWRYDFSTFKYIKLTYDIANKVFTNYIKEFNINVSDIFTLDYSKIIKQCRMGHHLTDCRYFAVQYNKLKYPGYMFKITGVNYYKNDENILFDLKYLIEEDMKLDIHKIPLYLTKNVLQKKCLPLYRQIVTHKNGSLFYWIDKLYPNQFIETDFDMNPYRNEFDSDTELYIHEILKERFKSIIYNQRNTENTIEIDGMIPDWFIFTSNGVWIIEYFGMFNKNNLDNSRVQAYKKKMDKKIEKYKNVKGYNLIFLYPNDIEDDFKGCRAKFDQIT